MNARQTQAFATRAASLVASLAVTALIVGSQLGIAERYTPQADARMARNPQPPVAQHTAPAPQRRS